MILGKEIEFTGVKGIEHLSLTLSNENMNVLIGTNGAGKTKALECLYTLLFLTHELSQELAVTRECFIFNSACVNGEYVFDGVREPKPLDLLSVGAFRSQPTTSHRVPVVYLAAQNRGAIEPRRQQQTVQPIGEYRERQKAYISSILGAMRNGGFSMLNANSHIDEWFIQRAQSANPYQSQADNREVELLTVLRILNAIDARISVDKQHFKVIGGKNVSITVEGQPRQLNELSSGFASLIKIVQSIVAGYGFFTNADTIEEVAGYVLIDEIESHLHVQWQSQILPLLQSIFPNTHFIVSTHSSLVLAQLYEGSAHRLIKDKDGVYSQAIDNPSKMALVDLLDNAFGINLNQLKINGITPASQQQTKNKLLSLLGDE